VVIEGASLSLLVRIFNVHRLTVSVLCSKLRDLGIFYRYLNKFTKLGGEDSIVEVDESKFGERKYYKGHRVGGVWVVGVVERLSRKISLANVNKRGCSTLILFFKKYICRQSIIFSDCWKSYVEQANFFKEHRTVKYSKQFINKQTTTHTNTIEVN